MKRISLLLLASLLLCATAYAAKPAISLMINGALVKSPVAPQIIKGTTMVPLRIISEALGATVDWNAAKQQVTVTMPTTGVQKPTAGLSLAQLNKLGSSVGLVHQLDIDGNQIGTGSAFVVNGIAVTNFHVADGNADTLVIDFGSTVQTVKVADAVFSNAEADLIGFRVSGVTGLKLGPEPKAGDPIYAMGYPSRKFTISEGKVDVTVPMAGFFSHTAPINSGSSGGVAINAKGEVIGITDGVNDQSGDNFAILASVLQAELTLSE